MILTEEQFRHIFPSNKNPSMWLSAFEVVQDFGISTPEQIAAFCSQIGHESLDMTVLVENLNYSAEALMRVFPKYFRNIDPRQYARKPEKIANRVYANRMGNGDELSGDGWKFRGRGVIQLTGASNYAKCSEFLYGDSSFLVNDPDLVKDDAGVAIKSALWYWDSNGLQNMTDIR